MDLGKLLLFVLVVSQLATACKPAAGTATSTPQPESTTSAAPEDEAQKTTVTLLDAEGNEIEFSPPAPDGIQNMLARVDAGDYTLSEAVLAGLKLYAGEDPSLDLFGGEEVQPLGGYRLSALAAQVLADADAPTQAEFQRVLSKIFPSPEILDAISARADQQSGQAPSAKAASPARGTACTTLWEEGFSTETRSICLLFVEFTERGHTYRVYYPEDRRGDSAFLAYVEAAAQAMRDSLRVYGALSEMRDINMLFTALVPESEEGEDTAAFVPELYPSEIRSGACPVLVLPTALEGPADDTFKQLIAHEIFHCVEYWRQGRSTNAAADWYIEGMAEYFSGVVYPSANNEHQYLDGFNYFTMTESIVDLQYSSWVFFQSLGNEFGKEFVIGLLDTLPTEGTRANQITKLAEIAGMPNVFHEFGQTFLEQRLRDENGSTLPMSPLFLPGNRFALTPSPDREFETTAFLLSRYLIRYEEAKQYQVALSASGDGLFTVHNREGSEWGELPLEIASPCGGMVLVGLVTAAEAGAEFSNRTHTEWLEEYECDRCLIGTWMQDTATIENNLRTIMGPAAETLIGVSGVFILDIAENAGTLFYPEDYAITFRTVDDEIAEMRMEGFSTGSYVIPTEGIIRSYEGETAFELTLTTPSGTVGMPVTPETAPAGPFSGGGEFPYTCTATTLTVVTEGVAPFPVSVYTRVSE
ncbi:MAG: hypothetical protein ACRDFQ_01470 [Anaerolineales bacterium]